MLVLVPGAEPVAPPSTVDVVPIASAESVEMSEGSTTDETSEVEETGLVYTVTVFVSVTVGAQFWTTEEGSYWVLVRILVVVVSVVEGVTERNVETALEGTGQFNPGIYVGGEDEYELTYQRQTREWDGRCQCQGHDR